MATGIGAWSTTAADNDDASTAVNWAEGQGPETVNNSARALMSEVAVWLRDGGWIEFKEHTHVYGSATTTTVASTDVTAYFTRGRRVRAVGSSTGTIYGRVVSSSFSTNTTVTYKWDASGALSNETLAISLFLGLPETQGGDLKGVINTAKATAVASASSCDIWATNGNLVHVTGTTTIADFGTAPQAGCFRIVIFDGALTLTHGASAIVLPGSANITTAANDVALVYADTTTKHLVSYFKASGVAVTTNTTGLLQRKYATYATNTDLTTAIPFDDTIPQNTEGTEIITQAITPVSASSRIRIRFQGFGGSGVAGGWAAALFVDSTADALAASATYIGDAANAEPLILEYEEASATTDARTYKINVGGATGTTIRLNGTTAGRLFGGKAVATLIIDEVL